MSDQIFNFLRILFFPVFPLYFPFLFISFPFENLTFSSEYFFFKFGVIIPRFFKLSQEERILSNLYISIQNVPEDESFFPGGFKNNR